MRRALLGRADRRPPLVDDVRDVHRAQELVRDVGVDEDERLAGRDPLVKLGEPRALIGERRGRGSSRLVPRAPRNGLAHAQKRQLVVGERARRRGGRARRAGARAREAARGHAPASGVVARADPGENRRRRRGRASRGDEAAARSAPGIRALADDVEPVEPRGRGTACRRRGAAGHVDPPRRARGSGPRGSSASSSSRSRLTSARRKALGRACDREAPRSRRRRAAMPAGARRHAREQAAGLVRLRGSRPQALRRRTGRPGPARSTPGGRRPGRRL